MKVRFKDKTANCHMKNDISKPLSWMVIMSTIGSCMVKLMMPAVTVLIKEICVIESMSPIDNEIFNQILYSEVKQEGPTNYLTKSGNFPYHSTYRHLR